MAEGVISVFIDDCVFIDECGYNIWTARSHGRASIGESAYRQVCGQRGRNVTITMAVSPMQSLIYHTAQVGGMNGVRFNDFLVQTRTQMAEEQHVIFIYDGAPAHRGAVHPGSNTELKMLPPHSPFLNIVEQAISALKAAIKADISQPGIQNQMNGREGARRQGIPLGEYRQRLLDAAQRHFNTITAAKYAQWYRFMQTYIPRCLNREPIDG